MLKPVSNRSSCSLATPDCLRTIKLASSHCFYTGRYAQAKETMKYYSGAYYLIQLREPDFGHYKGKKLNTCSICINDSLLDAWSISWTEEGKKVNSETKEKFNLNENSIQSIQKWSDQKFEEEKIGWICTFADLQTLTEYKTSFFPTAKVEILSINFPETEKSQLLQLFNPKESELGEIGLSKNLEKGIEENENEQTIGYDLIGVEASGEFHSFHCHDLASELNEKFDVEINRYGLLEENDKWEELVEYMNDEKNGFEPVPWFYVKVKKATEKASA